MTSGGRQCDAEGEGHLGCAADADMGHHRNEAWHGVKKDGRQCHHGPDDQHRSRIRQRDEGRHGGGEFRVARADAHDSRQDEAHQQDHAEMCEAPGVFFEAKRNRTQNNEPAQKGQNGHVLDLEFRDVGVACPKGDRQRQRQEDPRLCCAQGYFEVHHPCAPCSI
jgi:hypothetical protein